MARFCNIASQGSQDAAFSHHFFHVRKTPPKTIRQALEAPLRYHNPQLQNGEVWENKRCVEEVPHLRSLEDGRKAACRGVEEGRI